MTNEEVERAIDFLLKSQATSEARIDRLSGQVSQLAATVGQLVGTVAQLGDTVEQLGDTVAQIGSRLDSFADTQANIMRVMMQTLNAQDRTNESLRGADASMRAAIVELAGRQSRTEDALATLAETQASSDRRMGALIKIVEEGRGGGG